MKRGLATLLFATACSFVGSTSPIGGDGGGAVPSDVRGDARAIDAQPIDAAAAVCFTAGLITFCVKSTTPQVTLSDETVMTDSDGRCAPAATLACVIEAENITVMGTVLATGSRPLVLAASQSISVIGTLDVSSRRGAFVGAGANSAQCSASTKGHNGDGGPGGGGGGSFGDRGGIGGVGDQNGAKNPGGVPGDPQVPTTVRGGCSGGDGGSGTGNAGAGGDSGGAVYLAAATSISVAGAIFASGAGASGGKPQEAGGGGGGAGGLVGLEAPAISVPGKIAANGGGGGGGCGLDTAAGPGGDGTTTNFNTNAAGGARGDSGAGNGGIGSSRVTTTGGSGGGQVAGGAGGGGGGVGVVWVKGTLNGTQISPAPTQN